MAINFEPGCIIHVNNYMQKGYSFRLTEFEGEMPWAIFAPQLTPRQMLTLGVFDGKYMTDCAKEYPDHMFEGAKFSKKKDPTINCFGVHSGDSLAHWKKAGWLRWQDPRGWFEWYCRFWIGRRTDDDMRQIERWQKFATRWRHPTKPVHRQALLQWSLDPYPDYLTKENETTMQKILRIKQNGN